MRHSDIPWDEGLCRSGTYDPDIWFQEDTEDLAVFICNRPCPIIVKCQQWALTAPEKHGVWGGLTEQQRKLVGWKKSRIRCPGCHNKNVQNFDGRNETCLSCGISWQI